MTIQKINITININGLIGSIKIPKSMDGLNIPNIEEPENYTVSAINDNDEEIVLEYTVSDLTPTLKSAYDLFKSTFTDSDSCQVIVDSEGLNRRVVVNKNNSFQDQRNQVILEYSSMTPEDKVVFDDFIKINTLI